VIQAQNISGGVHLYGRPTGSGTPPTPPTPRQLPPDISGFVGRRDALNQLNAVLTDGEGEPVVVSVCIVSGTAGSGKTSLALHWAHRTADRFPDGQLYVNLRGYDPGEPVTARDALHRFLLALGVAPDAVPDDEDAAAAQYRTLLAERRMLVVLDNARWAGQVRPLLPGTRSCLALVTSRELLTGLPAHAGARRLSLGTLPQDEAVALLSAVTAGYRTEDDLAKLTELAELCARLPLALRIAAERAASRPHMRLDDLIADLRDESSLWDALSTGDGEQANAVRTVFAWSYRALPPSAARLFRLLGLHPAPEFGLQAAAALAGLPTSRTRQLLDSLVGAHLLEQTAPDTFQFHDLLRAYAADQARSDEPESERAAAADRMLLWYAHAADAAQEWISPGEPRLELPALPDGLRSPAFADYDAAVDWAERDHRSLLAAARTAADTADDALAWRLPALAWIAQPPSAPGTGWPAVARAGLDAARRLGDREGEARLLTYLGMGHVRANRLSEGLDCHRAALAVQCERGDRLGEADATNLVGLVHLRQRQLDDAARHFEQAIVLFRQEGAAQLEATALANLASARLRAGLLEQAADTVGEALAAHRALGNARGIGNALRLRSEVERERGETQAALTTAQEALTIALDLRDQRLEGYWLLTLGDAQQAAEEWGEALVSYQRSAALHRRLGDRSREALALHGAGETHRRSGRSEEAADFHRQAAAVFRELGEAWHEAVALDGLGAAVEARDAEAARQHRAAALSALSGFSDPRAVALRERIAAQAG